MNTPASVQQMLRDVETFGTLLGRVGATVVARHCIHNFNTSMKPLVATLLIESLKNGIFNTVLWNYDVMVEARKGYEAFVGGGVSPHDIPIWDKRIITFFYPSVDVTLTTDGKQGEFLRQFLPQNDGHWSMWAYAYIGMFTPTGIPNGASMWLVLNRETGAPILSPLEENLPKFICGGRMEAGDKITELTAPTIAWMEFMRQPFVEVERPTIPRADRRRAKKAGRQVPVVSVVTLRKTESRTVDNAHDSEREYTCQWLRRGHWRRLPIPRKVDGAKVTWVRQSLCGPDGKPLRTTAQVVKVVR